MACWDAYASHLLNYTFDMIYAVALAASKVVCLRIVGALNNTDNSVNKVVNVNEVAYGFTITENFECRTVQCMLEQSANQAKALFKALLWAVGIAWADNARVASLVAIGLDECLNRNFSRAMERQGIAGGAFCHGGMTGVAIDGPAG